MEGFLLYLTTKEWENTSSSLYFVPSWPVVPCYFHRDSCLLQFYSSSYDVSIKSILILIQKFIVRNTSICREGVRSMSNRYLPKINTEYFQRLFKWEGLTAERLFIFLILDIHLIQIGKVNPKTASLAKGLPNFILRALSMVYL